MQPEKIIIFAPMVIFFLIFGVLIMGFFGLVAKIIYGSRKSAWKGEVVDKIFNKKRGSFEDSDKMSQFYTLVFKLENGRQIKVAVSGEMYDDFQIGDKAEKKSGEFWPKKVV